MIIEAQNHLCRKFGCATRSFVPQGNSLSFYKIVELQFTDLLFYCLENTLFSSLTIFFDFVPQNKIIAVMTNSTNGTHHPSPDNSECPRALFLQSISEWSAIITYVVLMGICAVLCYWLRSLAIKPTVPVPDPVTPVPEASLESLSEIEAPPPYEPATEAAAATIINPVPKAKRSRASAFVVGTFILIILLFTQFVTALSIQNLHYCHNDRAKPSGLFIVFWTWYSIECIWASVGLSCWFILLRNLGGKKAEARWPMDEYCVLLWLAVAAFLPFALVGWVLKFGLEFASTPLVSLVESLQRRLCGDEALEDDDEEAGMRLEEGHGIVPEERQGLLQEATSSEGETSSEGAEGGESVDGLLTKPGARRSSA